MTSVRTWRDVLAEVSAALGSMDEARRLTAEAGGFTLAELVLGLDDPVPQRAGARLSMMAERRLAGEPLQYVLGRWGFRSLDLIVDRRALIPRPETEQVVEAALAEARRVGASRPLVVADLGTGSGAIALSLAAELPGAQVWATDISAAALEVASANLCGLAGFAATRVRLLEGSWFDPLPVDLQGRLDVVVCNPPYIADDEVLPDEVGDWEPALALRAGETGLECFVAVTAAAPAWLADQGVLVVEIAPSQADAVCALAVEAGFAQVQVRPDLSGRDRMIVARR